MPIQKNTFLIKPSNNTTDGFSHSKGNPVIKFSIPAQDLLLETSSLRLSGRIQFYGADDKLISVQGNTDTLSANDNGNSLGPAPVNTNLSNLGGVHNCIDKVVVKSKKSAVELVNDPNYSQQTAVRQALSNNKGDYTRSALNRTLACGNNADLLNRRLVNQDTQGQDFSIKLNVPFLGVQPLHLGEDYLGGLMMTLYLAPDSNVFMNRFRHLNFTSGANDIKGAYFKLHDLRLVGRYLVPTADELKAYQPDVLFQDKVNLINDVVSSVNSSGYTPQVNFVRGISNQFQKPDAINNYNLNANNFPQVVGLEQVVQSKNSRRFPFDFATNVEPNRKSQDQTGSTISGDSLNHKGLSMGDTEVRRQYYRSLLGGKMPYHSSTSLKETDDEMREQYVATDPAKDTGNNCFVDVAGIGCDYTFGLGMTQNYRNQDYSLEITSGVNTGASNLPADSNNITLLQQTFINDLEVVDTQKLVKTF